MTHPTGRPATEGTRTPSRVVVIGGGLAGLTAACCLAADGLQVTLLEARRRLGGATFSFEREVEGERVTVDNGQHVVLRCYERYLTLLRRLGTVDRLRFQARLRIPVRTPAGCAAALGRAELPPPAHMAVGIGRYGLLGVRERLAAVQAAGALARLDPADPRVDAVSFGDWLAAHGQGERARRALWNLVTVAALNAAPEEASLALAAMVLRTAFVDGGRDGADIGLPACSLDELHVAPAERYLTARGARVLPGVPARAVVRDDDGWSVRSDAGEFRADAVVLAVDSAQAAALVPFGAGVEPSRLRALGSSPIVSIHVWFDRPVLAVPFVAAVDSPLSWIFVPASQQGPGQYVTVPISAAHDWIDLPVPRIRERVLPALAALLPDARRARVVDLAVSRERAATFAQRPGTMPLRPPARTALPGLALAGAWTATGWPDTIEGAVRSGESAASVIREHLSTLPAALPAPALQTLGTITATGRRA